METTRDRLLLWLVCSALLIGQPIDITVVAAMLAGVSVSALNGYLQSERWLTASTCAYAALCIAWPVFCLFLPLAWYDALRSDKRSLKPLAVLPMLLGLQSLPFELVVLVPALTLVAYLLGQRSAQLTKLRHELVTLRDSSHEFSLRLQEKNRDLLEKQDYEVRLATLNERNRIAREIHDQVGHLLSRSILQVAAMLVAQPEQTERNKLTALRETLSQAMDSIRASVHNLHEESVDLKMQLTTLVDSYLFCPVHLDYRLESEPVKPVQYCFIAIVKEGLNNITRHSDASQVNLTLLEHPALYQLILHDNGSPKPSKGSYGLGLENMAERVAALGGQFLAEYQDGFRIFISVPKGGH